MSPAATELVGYAAAALTTAAFAPQVWHTWKTRDVAGISLAMYLAFTFGIALWLLYGWLRDAWPIVAANAVTLVLAAAVLAMKLRWGGSVPPGRPEGTERPRGGQRTK